MKQYRRETAYPLSLVTKGVIRKYDGFGDDLQFVTPLYLCYN
jgi:hypothetical protein